LKKFSGLDYVAFAAITNTKVSILSHY
jgi:hypothetical protein